MNKIQNIDAKDFKTELINNNIQFDLIITDPPYNISQKNNMHTWIDKRSGKSRKSLDFGAWDKDFDEVGWIQDLSKLVKPNGSVLIFNAWKNLGAIRQAMLEEGFESKEYIVWRKPSVMVRNMNRRYQMNSEFILWFTKKGAKWTFNNDNKMLLSELTFASPRNKIHPTQKPEKLISELIKIHSNENDLVLDLFMGSGVVAKCCKALNRDFYGCELDSKYYSDALNYINS